MVSTRRSFIIGAFAGTAAFVGAAVVRLTRGPGVPAGPSALSTPTTQSATTPVNTRTATGIQPTTTRSPEATATTAATSTTTSTTEETESTTTATTTNGEDTTTTSTTEDAATTSTGEEQTTMTAEPPPSSAQIVALCQAAWGAQSRKSGFVGHTVERLTVHHTAVVLDANRRAPARARQHQRFHQDSGWPDLAYHFLVDANGHVYEGRPVQYRGDTFTNYDPAGHFLVCAEGDFNKQAIGDTQLRAMADVLAWAAVEFGVSPSTIGGHRDYASTTCPGANFAPKVDDGMLRSMVEARISSGVPGLAIGCGDAERQRVSDIEAGRI